jgi:AbrB family looped-hinge helix DNA binding protein
MAVVSIRKAPVRRPKAAPRAVAGKRSLAGKRTSRATATIEERAAKAAQDDPHFFGKFLDGKGKVSSKGWVVIPKAIRDEMGIMPGDEVSFSLFPPMPNMKQVRGLYTLHVRRVPEDIVSLAYGMFKQMPGEPSWTDNLLRERREDLEREEREIREDRLRHRG